MQDASHEGSQKKPDKAQWWKQAVGEGSAEVLKLVGTLTFPLKSTGPLTLPKELDYYC